VQLVIAWLTYAKNYSAAISCVAHEVKKDGLKLPFFCLEE